MRNIVFVNSHPIQYFAPLYKYLNQNGIKTSAWYCSDESIKGGKDSGFGVNIKWDIPLLDGYEYRFFKNRSWKPSHANGFFGLINPGLIRAIFKIEKSVVIVHGWHYCTNLLVLLLAGLRGHTVCFRYEMPQKQELFKKGWKQSVKKLWLKYIVFPRIDYFLYIGTQNRLLYKDYNIKDAKLIFCPYSVDNERFRNEYLAIKPRINSIKEQMGIPAEDKIILFSGKYVEKKKPMDILNAYIELNNEKTWLIMMGDGEQRKEMEALISKHSLTKVILAGFINQSKISEYYAISDVFVMCSSIGETWGLSVNEALNFGLPVISSDLTGSSDDLVIDGVNGYVFETGNIKDLALKLKHVLIENKLAWTTSSQEQVDKYSYAVIKENLSALVN